MKSEGSLIPIHVTATTIDDAWHQLLYNNYKYGTRYKIDSGSFAGDYRVEFDFVSGFIANPHIRPLAPMMPEASSLPAPTTDDAINDYFANYIMDPNLTPEEEYRYSTWINGQILKHPYYCQTIKCPHLVEHDDMVACSKLEGNSHLIYSNFDFKCPVNKPNTQLEWIIEHFKTKGYGNNHCFIQVGNPWSNLAYDRPWKTEMERGTSPCLRGIDFKIKNNQLITHVYFRSWDLYGGFPENMGGFTLLNEYVAAQLDGVEPGPLAFSSTGLHCYGFQLDVVAAKLGQ